MAIYVLGSINTDLFFDVPHFVRPGETLMPGSVQILPGGKGLNQAVACAKAGSKTWMGGRIGKDGEFLLEMLNQAGVNTDLVGVDNQILSGKALIQRDAAKENAIVLYPGTNHAIFPAQVDEFFDSIPDQEILLLQNEISSLPYILQKAKTKQMQIFFNPAPMTDEIKALDLSMIDVLIVNETEGKELLGEQGNPKAICAKWVESHPDCAIVMTLSSKGSLYMDHDYFFEISAYTMPVVDTTGAGDTFIGYLVSGIDRGLPIEKALKQASYGAALSVTKPGAAPSIPTLEQVEAGLKALESQAKN